MIVTLLFVAAWLLVTAPAAVAQDAALERYRPVLRYDAAERVFPSPVGSSEGRPVVYGRVARGAGRDRWLQYWLYYTDNPQDRGILRTGRHEGDWELVQIRLDFAGRPMRATLRAHTWAQTCPWDQLHHMPAGAPIVYVANASHAHYSRPGTHDRPWPDPNDEADGRGRALRPRVVRITERSPQWITSPARFGDSEASFIPGEQSSPQGPAFQPAWSAPADLEREGRECTASPPGRPWQTALTGGVVALAVILVAGRIRRRRRLQA